MQIRKARPSEARRQAEWISGIEPWRSLEYQAATLGSWLDRCARRGMVRVAVLPASPRGSAAAGDRVRGIIVLHPEVLLGRFIALLAVAPWAEGQGVGRELVQEAARQTFHHARWLYTSSDAGNRDAAAFYRRMGFTTVGRLPDMVRAGRTEILWRLGRPRRRSE